MRKIIFFLLFSIFLSADTFSIKYKGIILGKIDTLDTLQNNYLKARVTNSLVKLFMRKDYFIFYDGKKPQSQKTKYRKDNKKILFALKQAIESKPKNTKFIIDKDRYITLKCYNNICSFNYYTHGNHNAMGKIEFQDGKFYKLTEEKSSLEIIKD